MQNPDVTIGGSTVIATGMVVHLATDVLRINPTGPGMYFVEFRFISDLNDLESRTVRNFNEGTGHVVECKNFDKAGGIPTTLTRPLHVGDWSGNKLLLMLSISFVGGNPQVIQLSYTFYSGGPIGG